MASADFSQFSRTSLCGFCRCLLFPVLCSPVRPPRVRVSITFPSYICRIYTTRFGQYWTLLYQASSSVSQMPYIRFLFVRPRVCLRLPSDSTSRWTPLPLANSSYCQVCSGLSPPSYRPCRAHLVRQKRQDVFAYPPLKNNF